MSVVYNFWLRAPRKGWRNDGGPIPRGFRSSVKRAPTGKSVVIENPLQRVRKGHWVVMVGSQAYAFAPAEMRRL